MNSAITRPAPAPMLNALFPPEVKGQGFKYLDLASLLEFCRLKLQESDRLIRGSMNGLDSITAVQEKLVKLKSLDIKPSATEAAEKAGQQAKIQELDQKIAQGTEQIVNEKTGQTTTRQLTDADKDALRNEKKEAQRRIAEIDANTCSDFQKQVDSVAADLDGIGQSDVADAVRNEAKKAIGGGKDAVDSFRRAVDAQITTIGASREMAMVHLQAMVSQRGTILQMTTNMISALGKSAEQLAANIGR